jgi:hypothetical protein
MGKSAKPGAPQRRFWRMSLEAPLGEFVVADEKAVKPAVPPAPDELRESSWVRSSWDLLNGLEVTESSSGELIEELFDVAPPGPPPGPGHERVRDSGEWVRRFALRLAELDRLRDPREVIELARRQWTTKHDLAPERAAELAHGRPATS